MLLVLQNNRLNVNSCIRWAHLTIGVSLRGERITLFVVQVFLEVEEGVEEYWRQLASLQVRQGHLAFFCRVHHVQHLRNLFIYKNIRIIFAFLLCIFHFKINIISLNNYEPTYYHVNYHVEQWWPTLRGGFALNSFFSPVNASGSRLSKMAFKSFNILGHNININNLIFLLLVDFQE